MLFNSLAFALFLPTVFLVYWTLASASARRQNALLLVASYVFYGWWDWRFLGLIAGSSLVDYLVGLRLGGTERPGSRKLLLAVSLFANLGTLGVFKYFGFFTDSLATAAATIGWQLDLVTVEILLPVGISFYTFQTLSYTIDVYRRQISPTRDPLAFFGFVSFFPQLVAGPIERAASLLPQFERRRSLDVAGAKEGLRLMAWGLVKKVVVADGVAMAADQAFADYPEHNGLTLAVGVFLFGVQIYCDFSGYSDIAIGCARLFGHELSTNFRTPYFATSFGEFWKRWHISLSTWFRDYVYIPLGGSRGGRWMHLRNVAIVFLVSGLWHGAAWTFVAWGALHALYYVPETFLRRSEQRRPGRIEAVLKWAGTLSLVMLAWTFFRAPTIGDAFGYLAQMFVGLGGGLPAGHQLRPFALGVALLAVEWASRKRAHPLDIGRWPRPARWATYYATALIICALGNFGESPFIYFQF